MPTSRLNLKTEVKVGITCRIGVLRRQVGITFPDYRFIEEPNILFLWGNIQYR